MEKIAKNNPSELIEITFIEKHSQSGKVPGDITKEDSKYAAKLIKLGFARLTTEEDKAIPPEKEFVKVIFLRAHPRYAYSRGDDGSIDSELVDDLVAQCYVELMENIREDI